MEMDVCRSWRWRCVGDGGGGVEEMEVEVCRRWKWKWRCKVVGKASIIIETSII